MIGDCPNARLISAIARVLALEDVNLLHMFYPCSLPTDLKPFRNMIQDEV
jgi:hypothetical protein